MLAVNVGRSAFLRLLSWLWLATLAQIAFGISTAAAMSSACTTINAQGSTTSYTQRFLASDFQAGESVSVTFSDNGAGVGGNPTTADAVLLSASSYAQQFRYTSDTGTAGSHSGSVDSTFLQANGLYIRIATGTYISPVAISCASAVSSDATLSNLSLSAGTLTPSFASGVTSYTASVANSVATLNVTPTLSDARGTITVNGALVTSGTASGAIPLAVGSNAVTIMTTAQDGMTTRSYAITVTRAGPAPVAGATSLTVAANSVGNTVPLALTGGAATSVAPVTVPAHGSVTVSGTWMSYSPFAGYVGTDSFTYSASNAWGTSSPATVDITVTAPSITIAPAGGTLSSANVGAAYSQAITASGGAAPYSYAVTSGALPAGLALNTASGMISGTPTAAGSFTLSIRATDAGGNSGLQTYTLSVAAPTISIAPATLPAASQGSAYSQVISASGGTPAYTYAVTAGTLPAGLSLTSGGVLSGTPTAAGTFTFTVRATDSTTGMGPFSSSQSYTLTVNANPPAITTTSLGSASAGVPYRAQIAASGGTTPYAFSVSAGALPAGLSLSSGGLLSGTPGTSGTYQFTVRITDANGAAATQDFTLMVAAGLAIGTASVGNGQVGVSYSQTLTATGGTAPYAFSVSAGALPAGLSLSSSGVLSGAPTASGSFTFTVQVKDASNTTATQNYTLSVAAGLSIGTASVNGGQVGVSYSQTLAATGGTAPYAFSVSAGALPAGLALSSNGVLSGTPTASGSFSFTVQVRDGINATATQNFSLSVVAGLALDASSPAGAQVGAGYSHAFAASGGTAPFTFTLSSGALPAGLTLSSSGTLSGTPTASGTFPFAVRVTDANRASATQNYTITVKDAPVPVVPAGRQVTVAATAATTVDITEGATGGPFVGAAIVSVSPASAGTATIVQTSSYATVQSAMPRAAGSGGTFSLRFVPAAAFAGTAAITFTLSNAYGKSDPAVVNVVVAPRADPSRDPDVVGLVSAQTEAARRFAQAQIDNYSSRLQSLHGPARSRFKNGLAVALPGTAADASRHNCVGTLETSASCPPGGRPAGGQGKAAAGAERKNGEAEPQGAPAPDADLAFWTAGVVDFGLANAGMQRSGFRFTTGGVTAGADYRVSNQLTFGIGFGYGHDSADIGSSGTRSIGDSYSVALYGSYAPLPNLFVDGIAGYGSLRFDSRRWVSDANAFATGQRNGQQVFAALTAGYEHRAEAWMISPYGRVSTSSTRLKAFTEQGVGTDALSYFVQTVNTVSGTLGLRGEYTQPIRWGLLMPYARIEYQHDFTNRGNAGLAYADLAGAGAAYTVSGTSLGANRMQFGLGAKLATRSMIFGVDYDLMSAQSTFQQGVRLWVSKSF